LMMNPVPWLQMTNMISYQGLVRTFPNSRKKIYAPFDLDGFSDFSKKIDARLMNNKARRSISEA
ncbi:hypothetical protein Q7I36_15565, partial [Aeromonas veronii]